MIDSGVVVSTAVVVVVDAVDVDVVRLVVVLVRIGRHVRQHS